MVAQAANEPNRLLSTILAPHQVKLSLELSQTIFIKICGIEIHRAPPFLWHWGQIVGLHAIDNGHASQSCGCNRFFRTKSKVTQRDIGMEWDTIGGWK